MAIEKQQSYKYSLMAALLSALTWIVFLPVWLVVTPVIPKENILLIEGIHDLFAARQPIEDLWQKWEQPEIWRLPHGHISAQLVLGLMGHVLRWLAPRLEAGGKNNA